MAPWLQLWYVYISYRFSLFQPFGGAIGIASDTIAIVYELLEWTICIGIMIDMNQIIRFLLWLPNYE
jgi:hypothetical protein